MMQTQHHEGNEVALERTLSRSALEENTTLSYFKISSRCGKGETTAVSA